MRLERPLVLTAAAFFLCRCVWCDDIVDKAQLYLGNHYSPYACKSPTYPSYSNCSYTDLANPTGPKKVALDCSGLVQYSYDQAFSVSPCHISEPVVWPRSQKNVAAACDALTELPEGAGQQYFSSLVQPLPGSGCPKQIPDETNPTLTTQLKGSKCALDTLIHSGALQRGDLLFFDSDRDGTVGHVGIYKGAGAMIDAFGDSLNNEAGGGIREDNLLTATTFVNEYPYYPTELKKVIGNDDNFWVERFLFAGRVTPPGVTYTYTGLPFTSITGSPGVTGPTFISASLTFQCSLPSLLPTFVIQLALPSRWTMTDGAYTLSSTDPNNHLVTGGWVFGSDIETDGFGHISGWTVYAETGPSEPFCVTQPCVPWMYTTSGFDRSSTPNYYASSLTFGTWSGASGTSTCVGPVSLGAFDAGGWSGNNYVYDWLPFSPSTSGKLAGVIPDSFWCANGNCNGCDVNGDNCGASSPAFYAICGVNAGTYNSCPSGSLIATSDPSTSRRYGRFFTFSGSNQVTLNAGQTYWVRPYICSFGQDACVGGQALAGGVQSFFGLIPK